MRRAGHSAQVRWARQVKQVKQARPVGQVSWAGMGRLCRWSRLVSPGRTMTSWAGRRPGIISWKAGATTPQNAGTRRQQRVTNSRMEGDELLVFSQHSITGKTRRKTTRMLPLLLPAWLIWQTWKRFIRQIWFCWHNRLGCNIGGSTSWWSCNSPNYINK